MSTSLFVLLLLSSFQLVRVASFSLSISPDHVHTSHDPQSVSFNCSADVALTGCQVRWLDHRGKAGPLLELSRGAESRPDPTHLDTGLTGYSYTGRGLGAGDCGVSLQVEGYKEWMVACRVRAETGGWTYAWADLYASIGRHLPNTRTPRESVVLPGGEARFTWKAEKPLSRCYFYPPGLSLNFSQGAQSPHSTGRHRYLGGGLGGGECGLALTNVSEADNGRVTSYIVNSARTKGDHRYMALIVARPPGAPTLTVVYTDAGVTATCEVHEGRPVANITWVLGGEVVRQDSLDDRPGNAQDEWRWPWMQGSILQRLTLGRQAEDHGKVLKCVASHVALARPLEATETFSFTEPISTLARATVETTTTAPSPNASLGPTCTATSMLSLLCQEYRLRASQLGNTSCPGDEVYEFRVREARAAARTAELAEQQAMVTLEAAKATAKSDAETKAAFAKVALEAAKSDAETKAAFAKVALEAAKSDAETKATLGKMAEEQAKSNAETKAVLAKVALEAEAARVREEEAWAMNAEEELQFERERRRSLQQPQSPQSVQGLGQHSAVS